MAARDHAGRCNPLPPSRLQAARVLLALLLVPLLAAAGVTEAALKSAFVYNFTKLVTWPDDSLGKPSDPFIVGVVGTDPLGDDLDAALRDKTVAGRSVVVKRWKSADETGDCRLLWVGEDVAADAKQLRKLAARRSVLLVGDSPDFAGSGGMVRLYREESADGAKIRFEFNVEAAKAAGLEVSSKLLSLARIVTGHAPGDP